jgi:hypothetical protein
MEDSYIAIIIGRYGGPYTAIVTDRNRCPYETIKVARNGLTWAGVDWPYSGLDSPNVRLSWAGNSQCQNWAIWSMRWNGHGQASSVNELTCSGPGLHIASSGVECVDNGWDMGCSFF